MNKVELTHAKLAELKQKAEAAKDVKWPTLDQFPQHEEYPAAEHIAAADPATVLALLDELTDVRMALLELAWEFYGRDQTREEIESCCAVMVENERASRKESEFGHGK